MTEKQVEQREKALARSKGVCFVCGKPLNEGQMQLAHKIGNTETNRKLYGSFFIDSTYNGELVCSLDCNASLDVGKSKGNCSEGLQNVKLRGNVSRRYVYHGRRGTRQRDEYHTGIRERNEYVSPTPSKKRLLLSCTD